MSGSTVVRVITKIPAPNQFSCFFPSLRIFSAFLLGFKNIHVFPKNLEIRFGDPGATDFGDASREVPLLSSLVCGFHVRDPLLKSSQQAPSQVINLPNRLGDLCKVSGRI